MCFFKKKYRGRIFMINDSLLSRDNFAKANRRVVVLNENPNKMRIAKIKGLYDSQGNKRKNLIPIGKYKTLTKKSGIHLKVYNKTRFNTDIKASKMFDTNNRLRVIDRIKIRKLK